MGDVVADDVEAGRRVVERGLVVGAQHDRAAEAPAAAPTALSLPVLVVVWLVVRGLVGGCLAASVGQGQKAEPIRQFVIIPAAVRCAALKEHPQILRVDGQRLVVPVAKELAVADVAGPWLDAVFERDVVGPRERLLVRVRSRDRRPLAVEPVGEIRPIVAAGPEAFDQRQVFVRPLDFVGHAPFEERFARFLDDRLGALMPLGNSSSVVRLRYSRPLSPVKNR